VGARVSPERETEAVFLHEVGHVRDKLTYKLAVAGFILPIIVFFVTLNVLINMFGNPVVASILSTPGASGWLISSFKWWYPKYKYRADEYAASKGYDEEVISVLRRYQEEDTNMFRRWFYPSFESRIQRIKRRTG